MALIHKPAPGGSICAGVELCLSVISDRLAPLSEGRIQGGHLACNYHGWEFDTKGACLLNPQVTCFLPPSPVGLLYVHPFRCHV